MDASLVLDDLSPDPCDEWTRLLAFVGWCEADRRTATRTVECLLGHSRELVIGTYDHLARVPETAAILGWEGGPVPDHLAERRAFLAGWLARTLGLDTSDEFALYLFRAGLMHAGLGPRRVNVPPGYLTATIGLVLSGFARCLAEDGLPVDVIGPALGVWSRYLSVQLQLMLSGYHAATALHAGPLEVRCTAYGRLRALLGGQALTLGLSPESRVRDVLCTVFRAYPAVRAEVLDRVWDERSSPDGNRLELMPIYVPRPGWRVLLNGRDVRYGGGLTAPVSAGDEVALFPPGR